MDKLEEQVVLRACQYRDQIKNKQAAPAGEKEQAKNKERLAQRKLCEAVDLYQNTKG